MCNYLTSGVSSVLTAGCFFLDSSENEPNCWALMTNSVIQMSGGLGNQLFQFALKKSVEHLTGSTVKLDIAWYQYQTSEYIRGPEILRFLGSDSDYIDSTNQVIGNSGLLNFRSFRKTYKRYVENSLFSSNTKLDLEIRSEGEIEDLSDIPGSYAVGSFIGIGLWRSYSAIVLDEISKSLSHADIAERYQYPNRVVIHARRGDYISDIKTRNFHGYCGLEHFTQGIAAIGDAHSWDSVLIHSDSPEFALKLKTFLEAKYAKPVSISTESDPLRILLDFQETSFFIGSNSTLSWWGNALGSHKCSVFPSSWFASENNSDYDKSFFLKDVKFTDAPLLVTENL